MLKEGISYDKLTDEFLFNWEADSSTDIINLVDIRNKTSKKIGVEYYVAFVALPKNGIYSTEYKEQMTNFRDKLKKLELNRKNVDRMVDRSIEGLINVYGKQLENIGVIVTPKSGSPLNRLIAKRVHELIPNARLLNDVIVKNKIDNIIINTEKIKGTPEQKSNTVNLVLKMLDKFRKNGTEFKMAKIHPRYRNLIGNFITMSMDIGADSLLDIKTKNILFVDDYLTKGFTTKESINLLNSIKDSGEIINFMLILQG
jgi:pyrimidine operon attenuation protein/uracil phosphoribosyltransferase